MPVYADPQDARLLPVEVLRSWSQAMVVALGGPDDIAADVAEILVAADRRGIASHGTARLPNYAALVEAGVMLPAARPTVEVDRAALVVLNAGNGWGHHAGRVAIDRAIDRARGLGCGDRAGAQLEPLRDCWLVRPARGGRGHGRPVVHQQLAAGRSDARAAAIDRDQSNRDGRPGWPSRHVLPGHGYVDRPARPDRGRRAPWRDAARRLGDRARRAAGDDA